MGAALLLFAGAGTGLAVPADPSARAELKQPSGARFVATPFGDEWSNGFETKAGYTIVRSRETRQWQYAERSPRGGLRPGGIGARREPPKGLPRHLRARDSGEARAEAEARLKPLEEAPDGAAAPAVGSFGRAPDVPNTGTQPSLVILVEFADQASLGTTPAQWAGRYFGATSSVADYYDEVSFGSLDIAPAAESHGTTGDGVIGWLTLSRNHPRAPDVSDDAAMDRVRATVGDAILAADPFIDYGSYDADGSGFVTAEELHITVIPAGWEASQACTAPSVWGHKYTAWDLSPDVDGVSAGWDYTMFGEQHCNPSPHLATVGIMAHEIGHDLDWPDLYDIDYTSADEGGVGYWSVMALGSWLTAAGHLPGADPPHPDAFSKYYQGWIEPHAVTGTETVTLGQAATNPDAVRLLDNPSGVDWSSPSATTAGHPGTGEYFLVENRQKVGYDSALPGCGFAIWHVDETRDAAVPNMDDSRRMLFLEQRDANNWPFQAGDAWLGGVFDGTSTPNSDLYSGAGSGVAIGSFASTCAAEMSAQFSVDGTVPPPETTIGGGPLNGATIDDATPTFTFTSDNAAATFECAVDAGAFAACASPYTTPALSEATHSFKVRARVGTVLDATSASRTFTVDLGDPIDDQPPETALTGHPAKKTKKKSATFSFTANEASTFECRLDGGPVTPCTSPQVYRGLKRGRHSFGVWATDLAGNADDSPAAWRWKVKKKKKR